MVIDGEVYSFVSKYSDESDLESLDLNHYLLEIYQMNTSVELNNA